MHRLGHLLLAFYLLPLFTQGKDIATKLETAKTIFVRGCPLTVYYHGNQSLARLAPAFCVLLHDSIQRVPLRYDAITEAEFISIPLAVTDSRLLDDANDDLRFSGRDLSFLIIDSGSVTIENSAPWPMDAELLWTSGQDVGYLRLYCYDVTCRRLQQQISDRQFTALDSIRFVYQARFKPMSTASFIIRSQVAIANATYSLLTSVSANQSDDLNFKECKDLEYYKTTTVEDCIVTIHRRGRMRFFIEPLLCYNGNYTVQEGIYSGTYILSLYLQLQSARVLRLARELLIPERSSPVEFMTLTSATMDAIRLPWLTFDPLRVTSQGQLAELRVYCQSEENFRTLGTALKTSPIDFWRQIRWTIEAVANNECKWKSQEPKFSLPLREPSVSLSHPSDFKFPPLYSSGLLCIRDETVLSYRTWDERYCAKLCSGQNSSCQGYSHSGGLCKLFVSLEMPKTTPYCSDGDKILMYTIEPNSSLKAYETYHTEQTYSIPFDGSMPRIYRSGILDQLKEFASTGRWQIVVEMRTANRTVAQAVFSAEPDGLDKNSWFTATRLLYTRPFWFGRSYYNFFSIFGDAPGELIKKRRFLINRLYGGCERDTGLFFIADSTQDCGFAQGGGHVKPPVFVYNTVDDSPYEGGRVAYAEKFLIYLRSERSTPSPHSVLKSIRTPEAYFYFEIDKLLLFTVKSSSGHQAVDTFLNAQAYTSKPLFNASDSLPDVYRSALIDNLAQTVVSSGMQYLIAEMRVHNRMVSQIVFDVSIRRSGLNKLNWFDKSRIVTSHPDMHISPWTEMHAFAIPSDENKRGFRIFFQGGDCLADKAFWAVSDAPDRCAWAANGWRGAPPVLVYTETVRKPLQAEGAKYADRFLIYLK